MAEIVYTTSKVTINTNSKQVVGVGYADCQSRKFLVSEFNDNDQFSNLEVSPFTFSGHCFRLYRKY